MPHAFERQHAPAEIAPDRGEAGDARGLVQSTCLGGGEGREVAPGLYLGQAYLVTKRKSRLVLYFGLQQQA